MRIPRNQACGGLRPIDNAIQLTSIADPVQRPAIVGCTGLEAKLELLLLELRTNATDDEAGLPAG